MWPQWRWGAGAMGLKAMGLRKVFSRGVFRTAKVPLFGVALVVLVSCGTIEEQCRSRYGASETAYDQCVERQHEAIKLMFEDQRRARQSIPDFE